MSLPSKLDLQLEALLSVTADQQWEAMPLCVRIKPQQHRRDGFRFRSQRWTLSVQKPYRPRLRKRCHWTFIYHKLLGLQFHFLPERGGRCIFRLSWEAAAKQSGSACTHSVSQAHMQTLLALEELHKPEQKGQCTKASCRLLCHRRDCMTHFNVLNLIIEIGCVFSAGSLERLSPSEPPVCFLKHSRGLSLYSLAP